MHTSIFYILKFVAIPVVATLLAGAAASYLRVGPRLRSAVQHLAAGVVFAAAAGEILPEIKTHHDPIDLVVGFTCGITAMLIVRTIAERIEKRADESSAFALRSDAAAVPVSMLITVAIDVLLDGVLIGISFAAGEKAGVLLTIALTFELVFLALAVSASLADAQLSRLRRLFAVAGIATLLLIGGVGGGLLQGALSPQGQTVLLSFGLAALLFLVVEELLVEAHEVPETAVATSLFFVGFLALTVVEMLV